MIAEATVRTLLEDWQARRDYLAGAHLPPDQHVEVQLRVLDYLLGRYRDSPEAAQTVCTPAPGELVVNERAIVVHHHLWQGKVGGAKTEREAGDRVRGILRRMHGEEDAPAGTARCDFRDPSPAYSERMPIPLNDWAIQGALRQDPRLPGRHLQFLLEEITDPDETNVVAVRLLAKAGNRRAPGLLVLAWRQRLRGGLYDEVVQELRRWLCHPDLQEQTADPIREALADDCALVRIDAARLLAKMGSLKDIGLLCDLLNLPPQKDEDPREREYLAVAIQVLSQAR
jgi:hypothetical protein